MKVVVRVRPDNGKEQGTRTVVSVLDEKLLVFDPNEEVDDFYFQGIKRKQMNYLRRPNKNLEFRFDRVFDGDSTNDEVYEHTTRDILDGVLDGYNCSVFAYGATGAGKTFTMLGSPNNPGLIFLTMVDLYRRIEDMGRDKIVEVAVSYMEVYNERIQDLFSPGSGIRPIREDPQRGVVVVGLKLCRPNTAEELLTMLREGNKNRTQHPTDANAESSRSHAVFTVYIRQKDRVGTGVKVAKMSHIDLAGSERANMVSKNKGMRMREGANINKSLLALGNCINALAERKPNGHIPYRGSKLTRLLKDSLDGNCRTIMIAAVSPSSNSYEDTYNTLNYATRAKNIQMKLKQNVVDVDLRGSQLVQLVDDLRKELAAVKEELRQKKQAAVPSVVAAEPAAPVREAPPTAEEDVALSRLRKVFSERRRIQQELLHANGQARELEIKISCRRRDLESLEAVGVDAVRTKDGAAKIDGVISALSRRRAAALEKADAARIRLTENGEALESMEREAPRLDCRVLDDRLEVQRLKMELERERHQGRHLKRVALEMHREYERANRFAFSSVRVARRHYLLMKARGIATCDVDEDYALLVRQVEGYKGVVWADHSPDNDGAATAAECDHPLAKIDLKTMLDSSLLTVNSVDSCGPANSGALPVSSAVQRRTDGAAEETLADALHSTAGLGESGAAVRGTPISSAAKRRTEGADEEMFSDVDVSRSFAKLRKIDCTPKHRQKIHSTPEISEDFAGLNKRFCGDTTFTHVSRSPLGSTNNRRLTFELPAPSVPILKTGCDTSSAPPGGEENVPQPIDGVSKATFEPRIPKKEPLPKPVAGAPKMAHEFRAPKTAREGLALRRSKSCQQLPQRGTSGVEFGALRAVGRPAATTAVPAEKKPKLQWRMGNFMPKPLKRQ